MSTFTVNTGPNKNRFRNAMNKRLVQSLFIEYAPDPVNAIYTLADQDGPDHPSLRQIYLSVADPTEYRIASEYFENLDHWQVLCETEWFQPYINRWRAELALKIKSENLARIMERAQGDTKEAFAATRYLVDNDFVPGQQGKKGRPSKADIKAKAEAIFMTKASADVEADFERVLGSA